MCDIIFNEFGTCPYRGYCGYKYQSIYAEVNMDNLALRLFCENDEDMCVSILANEEIAKTYMVPVFESREQAIKLFNRLMELSNGTSRYVRAIALDGKLIGFINDTGIENDTVDIGYVLHPDYKNNGYMTQAVKIAIDELFDMGYKTVKAAYFESNIASKRVMEKCGMVNTGETYTVEYRGNTYACICMEIKAIPRK